MSITISGTASDNVGTTRSYTVAASKDIAIVASAIDSLGKNVSTSVIASLSAAVGPMDDANALALSLGYGQARKQWEDLFVGPSIDSTKWIPQMADQFGIWQDGGQLPNPYSGANGNGVILEYYDPAQITVNNGLTFTMVPSSTFSNLGYTYKSAAMSTHGKFYIPSGLVIAKIRAPDTSSGCWPGFWMLEGGVELDILQGGFNEIPGNVNQINFPAVFQPNGSFIGGEVNVGIDMSAGDHLYACEYKPGVSIKMWIDNFLMLDLNTSNSAIPTGSYALVLTHEMASPQAAGYHTIVGGATPNPAIMKIRGVQWYQ